MLDDRAAPFGYIIFCLAIGAFLIVIPWHELWASNLLLVYVPPLRAVMLNNYLRGAVSGLGAVDIAFGIAAIGGLFRRKFFQSTVTDSASVNAATADYTTGESTGQSAAGPYTHSK